VGEVHLFLENPDIIVTNGIPGAVQPQFQKKA